MLGLDTEKQINWQKAAKAEANAAFRQQALLQDIRSNTITVEDDAGRDTSNLVSQMGRPIASTEFQRRLKVIQPGLIFKRNPRYPELTAMLIERDFKNVAGTWERKEVLICGMESGIMPEFSVMHKTKKQIANPELFGKEAPTREIDWLNVDTFASETRGWRTVLVRLLHAGIITRLDVEKHFGWTPSSDSKKWSEQTR